MDDNFAEHGHSDIVDVHIGKFVAKLRSEREISANSLAKSLGVSEIELAMMERGQLRFTIENLTALSKIFEIDPQKMLPLASGQPNGSASEQTLPSAEETLTLVRYFIGIKEPWLRQQILEQTKSKSSLNDEFAR